ncbi:hypothetical protein BJ742DRAFT_828570 [Cladochytrium replicatum]|nr:hypothetical protein BJ742DRAFT_828570 [Cladochytrium replicatum]
MSELRGRSTSPGPIRERSNSRSPDSSKRGRGERGRSRSPPRNGRSSGDGQNPGMNLFVSGLSHKTRDEDLEALFSKHGKITKCNIMYDPHTRDSRGFAFICFETVEEADAARAELNQYELHGRIMTVERAKRTRARTPTPGHYQGPPKRRDDPRDRFEPRVDRYDPRHDPRYDRGPPPRGGSYGYPDRGGYYERDRGYGGDRGYDRDRDRRGDRDRRYDGRDAYGSRGRSPY